MILLLASLGWALSSCQDCTYANRLADPQCRSLSSFEGKVKINPVKATPPPLPPQPTAPPGGTPPPIPSLVSVQGANCALGSATLCNHYSNGAGVYAIIVPDAGDGTFVSPHIPTSPVTNCSDLWNNLASLQNSEVSAIYFGSAQVPGFSVACDDGAGCDSGGPLGYFTDFTYDPGTQTFTGGTPVYLGVGNYLVCAFMDSYNLTVPIPPAGQAFIAYLQSVGGGVSGLPPAIGAIPPDSTTDVPVPGSIPAGGSPGDFIHLNVTANTTVPISFTDWSDLP